MRIHSYLRALFISILFLPIVACMPTGYAYNPGYNPGYTQPYTAGYAPASYNGGSSNSCGFPTKTVIGGLAGGIGGGVLGNQIGHGTWNTVATIAGTFIGGALGAGVGQSLDNIDCMASRQATMQAVTSAPVGQPIAWQNNQNGNYGSTVVTSRNYGQYGQNCAQYSSNIVVNNTRQTATGTACQRPNGTWAIVPDQS